MRIIQRLILLLVIVNLFSTVLSAQTTWTGALSANWSNAGNWSAGVPGANDHVIIPDVTIDPLVDVANAVAQSVATASGSVLTISTTGTLTLNGAVDAALRNSGTIVNNGIINIGNLSAAGTNGLENFSVFTNASGAVINIDRISSTHSGIVNEVAGVFNNEGSIVIGSGYSGGYTGVLNFARFNNKTAGIITIDRTVFYGIHNSAEKGSANFSNAGVMRIGANTDAGVYGIENGRIFDNGFGRIYIDRVSGIGILNTSRFSTSGPIEIGILSSASEIEVGFSNRGLATNISSLTINNVKFGIGTEENFENNGRITIDKVSSDGYMVLGTKQLINNANATLSGSGNFQTNAYKHNGGTLSPGGTAAGKIIFRQNNLSMTGQGALAININGKGTAGVDYDQLELISATGSIGVPLALTVNYTPAIGDRFTIIKGPQLEGELRMDALPENGWNIDFGRTQVDLVYDGNPRKSNWNGSVSSDWNDSRNWSAGVPGPKTVVEIVNTDQHAPLITGSVVARSIYIHPDRNLTIAAGGTLDIDGLAPTSIHNRGNVQNHGIINIGSAAGGSNIGIINEKLFDNTAGGQVNINWMVIALRVAAGNFSNSGIFAAGAAGDVGILVAQTGAGSFTNNPGSEFKGTGSVASQRFINAGGKISPGSGIGRLDFTGNTNFGNSEINIDVNGNAVAASDYDLLQVSGEAILGGKLHVNMNYVGASGHELIIISAASVSGNFASITGLPVNWRVRYTATSVILAYDDRNFWTGNVSSAWNTSGNWLNNQAPGAGRSVVLPSTGVARELVANITGTISSLDIESGRTFTINTPGVLTVSDQLINKGTIKGTGTLVNANFINDGTIAPGNSPGILRINGNFTNHGTLVAEIGGTIAGTSYDQLVVNGNITIGGDLVVSKINNFQITAGQNFSFISGASITGTFTNITWPEGVTGSVSYTGNAVVLTVLTVLPLRLLEFTGFVSGPQVSLKWKTAQEENTLEFEVERSSDGLNYNTIETVPAGGNGAHHYSMNDRSPIPGNNHYRLKMKDIDGAFTYSPVRVVRYGSKKPGVQISPVPARSSITIVVNDESLVGKHAYIYSIGGRLVAELVLKGSTHIDVAQLQPGNYFIRIDKNSYQFVKL